MDDESQHTDVELQQTGLGITAHRMCKKMAKMLPKDVDTFLGKIKVSGSFSRRTSTFLEVFISQSCPAKSLIYSQLTADICIKKFIVSISKIKKKYTLSAV